MANEVYSKSYWGVGAITNSIGWGIIYKNLVGLISEILSSLKDRSVYYENEENTKASLLEIEQCKILEKASILITPNSYEDGVLNAALPIKKLGVEQVVNGDFETDSAWQFVGGAEFTLQGARINNTVTGVNSYATQNLSLNVLGRNFEMTYDIVATNGVDIVVENGYNGTVLLDSSTIGTNRKAFFNWSRVSSNLVIKRLISGTDVTITNVSLKEVISADLNLVRGSLASRTNSVGDIDNVDMLGVEKVANGNFEELGVEEVVNGDFATDSDWTKQTSWSISDGGANYDFLSDTKYIRQTLFDNGFVSGKTYKIDFEITSGIAYVNFSSNGGSLISIDTYVVGNYSLYFTASNNGSDLLIYGRNTQGTAFSIGNVSVKEVDPNDEWNKGAGWSIEDGKANCNGTQTSSSNLEQPKTLKVNTNYEVIITVSNYVSGLAYIVYGNTVNAGFINSNGTFKRSLSVGGSLGNGKINIEANSSFTGSIDSVSVKEVIEITNLPRINYDGFTGTENVLGEEQVVNGDFATDSDWDKGSDWTILGGKANANGSGNGSLSQVADFANNGNYTITFDVLEVNQGSVRLFVNTPSFTQLINVSEIGSYSVNVTVEAGSHNLYFYATNNFIGSIDNVSVKELIRTVKTGGKGHILLEGQATNLIEYSEDFTKSWWAKSNGLTISSITGGTAPDGSNNANTVEINSGRLNKDLSVIGGEKYTISCWYKGVLGETIKMAAGAATRIVTLTGEWQRESLTFTTTSNFLGFALIDNRTEGTSQNIKVWGGQFETGELSTYIPTDGGTATRLAETLSRGGLEDFIDSEEGVLYLNSAALSDDGSNRYLTLNDGTSTNRICILYSGNSNQIRFLVFNGSVQYDYSHQLTDVKDFSQAALKYKGNDFSAHINGVKLNSSSSGSTYPLGTLNTLSFNLGNGSLTFYSKIKTVGVFPDLTDTQLQCLTTQS